MVDFIKHKERHELTGRTYLNLQIKSYMVMVEREKMGDVTNAKHISSVNRVGETNSRKR